MKKKVVILGGGVAGMSAAHELIERGFDVALYEYKKIPGGKARSMPVPGSGTDGRFDLPGEHGFRFFPGFYRHITDTMKRIPYGQNENGVFDNLVPVPRMGMARFDHPLTVLLSSFPSSIEDLKTALRSIIDSDLNLSEDEIELAAAKTWQVMSSCRERKLLEYQNISWWEFIDAENQSVHYQKFFATITRTLVAAKAKESNTKTIGDVAAALFLDMLTPGVTNDRVLNGPTNDVWIGPWLHFLQEKGVDYHLGAEVTSIQCKNNAITSVTVVENGETHTVGGDYFLSALPVEVFAKLISDEMLVEAPNLAAIQKLSTSVQWMTGIQYYLKEDVEVVRGHVAYMDSPWALTSISQIQFWDGYDIRNRGDGTVKGILSVDVSDWTTPGILFGKTAMECTKEEIHQEVWEQIKRSLNHTEVVLDDEMLHSSFLDPDIQFLNPRDKINLEPLLVNNVHTFDLRPFAYTRIPNLFLASDYVRTNTDLASMEAANEAARRAVNCILDAADSDAPPCEIFEMYEHDLLTLWHKHDKKRFEQGLPWEGKILDTKRFSIHALAEILF
ncbi:FAD-dependent oxidoreductase [Tumebacillus sp. DT12]|uniref:FAD-dependent oxidoreductase n=1 Tax=Tumebacillus lacus TaxID=2995335 RepID=A0ABT3WZG9_9BACL|nr:FAD-dependent oxidoreductase [Tumebacillus lacus]MCX7568675.1 FAD-dependent oxidoreductase [Tumebacillus lacus]